MPTDGHRCPQADEFGEQQLFTHCQSKEEFIKLKQVSATGQQLKEIGPQADGRSEHEFTRIIREFKEIGPQADEGGEQQLFTHCQSKEEFIKLKQVSATGQQLKEIGPQADEECD